MINRHEEVLIVVCGALAGWCGGQGWYACMGFWIAYSIAAVIDYTKNIIAE